MPSLGWPALAGSASALLCAAGWGAVLGLTGLRNALPGACVGILVGFAVRLAGRRTDLRAALLAGGFSAWSCLLGNVAGFATATARERGMSAVEAIVILGSHGGEWLAEDATAPLSLAACLLAGIAGALVMARRRK